MGVNMVEPFVVLLWGLFPVIARGGCGGSFQVVSL